MTAIEKRVAVRDLDDEAAGAQPRQRVVRRDDVRLDRAIDQRQTVVELRLPQLLAPLDEIVAAPDVVDEDVELADLLEERGDLCGIGVIDAFRDSASAARGDDVGGLVDRLGTILHTRISRDAAAGAIDRGAGFAEGGGDAAAGAAGSARDESDFPFERFHRLRRTRGVRIHSSVVPRIP